MKGIATQHATAMRDNGSVQVPAAFVQQSQFEAEIQRTARQLAPAVLRIDSTLGDDWTGEPAVFFMVILEDSATAPDRLLKEANRASRAIVQEVQPLERWGVLPYFNFRSQSEHAQMEQPALV